MPMNFPDLKSLLHAAYIHDFREIDEGETEEAYRDALADHAQPIDLVESIEIRAKVGWNQFTDEQNMDMLRRSSRR